jgi:NADH:ubiquinone oxidoreductase subunit 6 (subunit J)
MASSGLLVAATDAAWLNRVVTCPTFWAIAVGSLALWLLIPGGRWTSAASRTVGGLLALVSGVLFAADWPLLGNWGVQVVFWLLAGLTLGSGVAMIASKSPVYSALWFASSLVGSAGLFLMQGAQFLGGATIVVYAGAIVVTFLFVIMLASPEGHAAYDRLSWGWFPRPAAILVGALLLGLLAASLGTFHDAARQPVEVTVAKSTDEQLRSSGGVLHPQHMANLGRRLFSAVAVAIAGKQAPHRMTRADRQEEMEAIALGPGMRRTPASTGGLR